MKIRPLADRVVIKKLEAEEKTASGIVLPGTAKEQPSYRSWTRWYSGRKRNNNGVKSRR